MQDPIWWKTGIIYQIYPRSFQDSNGDGVGDLNGIRKRLGYLHELGVDAIWISPIYPSPMADFGYDVSDYCGIDSRFGTMADFDALVQEAHRLGLKVILDFVPNHTSDRHPWFEDSRSSRASRKRNWYIWHDPAPDGGPPNNWVSNFGGSGWTFDESTGQYYYHAFLKEQPDLNWRNPMVRAAMYQSLRFWLDRGVDGFRVDVIWHLIKDAQFRDNPPNPSYHDGQPDIERLLQIHSADQPEVLDVIAGMRGVIDSYEDRVLIGEIYLPVERLVAYYGKDLAGAHLPFNFQLIHAGWNARTLAALVREYEALLPAGGWPNWVLGNHDQRRIASRVGLEQAAVAAILLLTLRGTPTMYYGDEVGMLDVFIPPNAIHDPWAIREPGLGVGRDPQRTPMQWEPGENAGFSKVDPWLPISDRYQLHNVATCSEDPHSLLVLYRRLIGLRRRHSALTMGGFRLLGDDHDVLIYERTHESQQVIVALNFSRENRSATFERALRNARILLSSLGDRSAEAVGSDLPLQGNEGVVILCER